MMLSLRLKYSISLLNQKKREMYNVKGTVISNTRHQVTIRNTLRSDVVDLNPDYFKDLFRKRAFYYLCYSILGVYISDINN